VPASHPFEEIVVRSDGTEAYAWLATGVTTGSVVNLRPFGAFRPGITPAEARTAFGPPARVERAAGETRYVYETGAGTVWVVEWEALSSADASRITRYALRMPVRDPPFSESLPPALRQLLSDEKRLESIGISSSQPGDAVVGLSVVGGRVIAVDINIAKPTTLH